MGCELSDHQPDVAAQLGSPDAVFRLSGGHPQGDLHHQRRGIAEHEPTKSDQDARVVSESGGRDEVAVPGAGTHRQEVDHADPKLESRAAAFRDSAGRSRRALKSLPPRRIRKKNISGMGLCPKPRDFTLSRQDSWTGRRAALALPESRPLSRCSGCVSAEPYPPLRSAQSTRDKIDSRLHNLLDAPRQ